MLQTVRLEPRQRHLPSASPPKRLSICLINPKFEPSYWGFDYALPLYPGDKRCTMITGALPALAGLVPASHEVVLLDENVEDIDFESLPRFDIVGVTGMNVQKERMREILLRLRELAVFTAVGGAYASVNEPYFDGLCDVLFVGEAETTWPEFLEDFAAGQPTKKVYVQAEKTDMTKVPKPRYDLLEVQRYASGALQFSRGCPFQCEFCDIIVTFGRRPRTKRPEQVIKELEDMRQAGFFSAFLVDDNFIGNKKAAKDLLRLLVPWQEKHGYPLRLSTEASINLADDRELLELLYAGLRRPVRSRSTRRRSSRTHAATRSKPRSSGSRTPGSTFTRGSSSALTTTISRSSKSSTNLSRRTAFSSPWSACSRPSTRRRSTSDSSGMDASSRMIRTATSSRSR
jgi:hypothetical protein